jgi:hypothetical protein
MSEFFPVIISLIIVSGLVFFISKRFKLSSRYDRKPRQLNTWSSLDHGIDPTVDEKP